jgi:integrase
MAPGVWRLRVFTGSRRANGSPIYVSRTVRAPERKPGAGSRLADRELAKFVTEVSAGKIRSDTETFNDLLDQWLEHCESIGRSPTTLQKYHWIADKVVRPELGSLRLSKLTARHLDRLYAKLSAKRNKATTIRRIHALISAALHQAERWGLVDENVARRAQPPPIHAVQVKAPTPEEVRTLIQAAERAEPTLAVLLLTAALTGARRGELCALRWSDLDWDDAVLTIARSVYETPGGGWAEKPTKSHAVRRVGLDEVALTVLRRHHAAVDELAKELGLTVPPDAFVFSRSPTGSEPYRPDVVTKFAMRIARATGSQMHLHGLRHFSATQAIGAGYDAVAVASRLGHADPSITLRVYSHALKQRDREIAAALGRTLSLPPGREA